MPLIITLVGAGGGTVTPPPPPDGGGEGAASVLQSELQPSPEVLFPSSHSSPYSDCESPSPQAGA